MDRAKFCKKCKVKAIRSARHDSFYCPSCMQWIEDRCEDSMCEYCHARPDDASGEIEAGSPRREEVERE